MRIEEKAVGSPREWSGPSIQIRIFWEASDEVPVSEQLQRTDIFGRMMLFVFRMLLLRFDNPISSTSNNRDAYKDTTMSLVTTNGYTWCGLTLCSSTKLSSLFTKSQLISLRSGFNDAYGQRGA